MAADTPTAFVSYSRVDSEFAMQLAENLKAAGANVWLDQLDIEPGTPWDSAIEEALLRSSHMLVILSTVSVTSDNVRDEVSYALSQQMKVIPVLYRECKVPFRLARLQHIDFRNDYDLAFKALLKTLRVDQQLVPSPIVAPSFEDGANPTEAAQLQRRDEEDRLQALRAEHLAQQARWEEERQQQLAQRAEWEEEQRLRDQAEAARQAEAAQQAEAVRRADLARQAEAARQAERARQAEAARLAEAERKRVAAELFAQKRKQEQDAKARAAQDDPSPALSASINTGVTDSPQPQVQSNTSTPSPLGRIVKYAALAGLLRAICAFASAFTAQLFGIRLSNLVNAILLGVVTGFILYRVLLLFKPELTKQQLRPILWVWIVAGLALAAIDIPEWLSPLGFLALVILPTTVAGAITGRILSRALQNPRSKGIIIGIVSFAIPVLLGQTVLRTLRGSVDYGTYGIMGLIVSFCVAATEVGLLLWFIRNWGRSRTTLAS